MGGVGVGSGDGVGGYWDDTCTAGNRLCLGRARGDVDRRSNNPTHYTLDPFHHTNQPPTHTGRDVDGADGHHDADALHDREHQGHARRAGPRGAARLHPGKIKGGKALSWGLCP